jgi:hypothetical protein
MHERAHPPAWQAKSNCMRMPSFNRRPSFAFLIAQANRVVTLRFVPDHFVPGHFVPVISSPGHFVPGHFVPWLSRPLVI